MNILIFYFKKLEFEIFVTLFAIWYRKACLFVHALESFFLVIYGFGPTLFLVSATLRLMYRTYFMDHAYPLQSCGVGLVRVVERMRVFLSRRASCWWRAAASRPEDGEAKVLDGSAAAQRDRGAAPRTRAHSHHSGTYQF